METDVKHNYTVLFINSIHFKLEYLKHVDEEIGFSVIQLVVVYLLCE